MLINRIKLYSRNMNSDMFDAYCSEKIYTRTWHEHLHERDNKQHCKSCGPSQAYPTRCSVRIYTLCSYYITRKPGMGAYSATTPSITGPSPPQIPCRERGEEVQIPPYISCPYIIVTTSTSNRAAVQPMLEPKLTL